MPTYNGTNGNDRFNANRTAKNRLRKWRMYGKDGSDILSGGRKNDSLYGGSGNDRLYGVSGNDSLYGGSGDDRLYGGWDHDTLDGGSGDDRLYGGWDHDTLDGGSGDDRLYGGWGRDTLVGGSGNDVLNGGWGHDALMGGTGDYTLIGGFGSDTYIFNSLADGVDTIRHFQGHLSHSFRDKIQVSKAGFGVGSLDQFSFDNDSGSLSFNGQKFANLELVSGGSFSIHNDIVLV